MLKVLRGVGSRNELGGNKAFKLLRQETFQKAEMPSNLFPLPKELFKMIKRGNVQLGSGRILECSAEPS